MRKMKIQTVEMIRCEACGGFHPESESEEVIIRVIKGKNCELSQNLFASKTVTAPRVEATPVESTGAVGSTGPIKDIIPMALQKRIAENRAHMPFMLPPDHPDFESKGAKERRRV